MKIQLGRYSFMEADWKYIQRSATDLIRKMEADWKYIQNSATDLIRKIMAGTIEIEAMHKHDEHACMPHTPSTIEACVQVTFSVNRTFGMNRNHPSLK
jgi:hypothetical protein